MYFSKGKKLFELKKYPDCTTEFDKIKVTGNVPAYGIYYDSIVNFFLSNIETMKNDDLCFRNIKLYNDIYLRSEKLSYELETMLNAKNELLDEEAKKKNEFIEEKRPYLELEAENYKSYYAKKINGKNYNQIGDILYEENFTRSYARGSVSITRYTKTYEYLWENGIKGTVKLIIDVWYSYGYGNLYSDMYYDLTVWDKIFWHQN